MVGGETGVVGGVTGVVGGVVGGVTSMFTVSAGVHGYVLKVEALRGFVDGYLGNGSPICA